MSASFNVCWLSFPRSWNTGTVTESYVHQPYCVWKALLLGALNHLWNFCVLVYPFFGKDPWAWVGRVWYKCPTYGWALRGLLFSAHWPAGRSCLCANCQLPSTAERSFSGDTWEKFWCYDSHSKKSPAVISVPCPFSWINGIGFSPRAWDLLTTGSWSC